MMTRPLLTDAGLRRLAEDMLAGPEGLDVAMSESEAERYAGPPPTDAEVAELAALAGEVSGIPSNVLCEAGFSIPAAMGCAACPKFTTCPATPGKGA